MRNVFNPPNSLFEPHHIASYTLLNTSVYDVNDIFATTKTEFIIAVSSKLTCSLKGTGLPESELLYNNSLFGYL